MISIRERSWTWWKETARCCSYSCVTWANSPTLSPIANCSFYFWVKVFLYIGNLLILANDCWAKSALSFSHCLSLRIRPCYYLPRSNNCSWSNLPTLSSSSLWSHLISSSYSAAQQFVVVRTHPLLLLSECFLLLMQMVSHCKCLLLLE